MRKWILPGSVALLLPFVACDRTGRGEYEVERPVVGTETDTVRTPAIETGTVKDTIEVPEVDVKTEKREVKVPKVEIEGPDER